MSLRRGRCGSGAHRGRGALAGKSGAGERAAQVVLGIAVVAGEQRTAELQNGSHPCGEYPLGEQLPRYPKIDNAPVRPRKTLSDAPAPHPVMVDLNGFRLGDGEWGNHIVGVLEAVLADGR